MRVLVACDHCKRQYDAGDLASGSRFRCRCGALVRVPSVRAKDAAVVRCSSCGGPRGDGDLSCRYCGADFTLHEQDLETMCPGCAARLSNRARFCHHCGTAILPEATGAGTTDRLCPVCGEGHHLRSRSLGSAALPFLECTRCAGLWLGQDSFRILLERARDSAAPDVLPTADERLRTGARGARGPMYRRCPVCKELMHRHNYGKRSGVVLDSCKGHGIWFDAHELERVLRWVRNGGEERAKRAVREEARHDAGRKAFNQKLDRMAGGAGGGLPAPDGSDLGALGDLLRGLFD